MSRPSSSAIGAVSGVTAGAVSAFITCPLDLVKTRMQNQIRTPLPSTLYASDGRQIYRSTSHALRTIFAEDGVRGLFRGLPVVLLGCMSNWAVYFTSYQILKQELAERMDKQQTETSVLIMAAMGAGALTSVATSPLWVVKSRIMTQSKTTEYNYTGTLHAFRDIWIKEGWRGYYKGLGSSLLGVSHVAIQFPIYEKMKMLTGADGLLHNNGRKRSDEDLTESGDTARLLAASIPAKFAASIATYPHEVIRTRLQNQATDPPRYRGIIHAVIKIFREEGPRAYYQGLSTNLIRTVPNSAITLLVYELMYRYLHSF
ncbi:mitochondrial carrier [Ramicandelaber brevisporus]|nr:mitochondrial carrier [Ramicandelaber brevisporus]